jgi:hypothetical protein
MFLNKMKYTALGVKCPMVIDLQPVVHEILTVKSLFRLPLGISWLEPCM